VNWARSAKFTAIVQTRRYTILSMSVDIWILSVVCCLQNSLHKVFFRVSTVRVFLYNPYFLALFVTAGYGWNIVCIVMGNISVIYFFSMFCENSSPNSFSAFRNSKLVVWMDFWRFQRVSFLRFFLLYKKIDGVWRVCFRIFCVRFCPIFYFKILWISNQNSSKSGRVQV